MSNTYNDFVNSTKKDPQLRIKINDMLNRYNKMPFIYIYLTI